MSRTALIGLSALLLLGVAACARPQVNAGSAVPAVGTAAAPGGGDATAFLQEWKDFPVTKKPRPIVLTGDAVLQAGYRTDNAKLAVLTARVRLAATPPAAPKTVTVHLADGTFTLPAISATQAFDQVVQDGSKANAVEVVPVLDFTSVTLGTAEFHTDRGPLRLPAWLFDAPEALGPVAVAAVAPSAFWQPVTRRSPTAPAADTIAADGVTLTVQLPDSDNKCPGAAVYEYTAVAQETATAIAVSLHQRLVSPAASSSEPCISDLMLRFRAYQVKLAAPLGNRVVIDGDGAATAVVKG
ncbi:hypothetical protein [Hamadaea tsunoensis]|uniref:hypothetical protein n=1 Tax=Hamadaea tsunoensis TaxID=53368 RepID=UPI000407CA25|nr:hypothetical protein [Hamadaea tsunoensis]